MQHVKLEILAPAKNKDIGIAAINCGADAVYIAGPAFGAREAAGNPVDGIAELAEYAHRFSARVYATVNTILYEDELEQARSMIWQLYEAGVDAIIVQDLGITRMDLPPIELHASTQCAIRTPEQARFLESLGFTRLILERELSMDQIREIADAVQCELEFFVHGALCVCYSGNCYLSQYLSGRSANRGSCIQACRSLYDLVDADGKVLVKDAPLLSLKDYRLDNRLEELAQAGICSFKIEGRLKNASYVKNIVRYYRSLADDLCRRDPRFVKASSGSLHGGFTPNPDATFNRGYTSLFIDGQRGRWNSAVSSKSSGEYIGTISSIGPGWITVVTDKVLANGDGLVFAATKGDAEGMRIDTIRNGRIFIKETAGLKNGQKVYRNLNLAFEKELDNNMPERLIDVDVCFSATGITARDEDGFEACITPDAEAPEAEKKAAAVANIQRQMGKRALNYNFHCGEVDESDVRFYSAAALNGWRRALAEKLLAARTAAYELRDCRSAAHVPAAGSASEHFPGAPLCAGSSLQENFASLIPPTSRACGPLPFKGHGWPCSPEETARRSFEARETSMMDSTAWQVPYLANCANSLARSVYETAGAESVAEAYELKPVDGAELMRTKYCIRYEKGMCPFQKNHIKAKEPLALVNAGKKLYLQFDCKKCEMIVHL